MLHHVLPGCIGALSISLVRLKLILRKCFTLITYIFAFFCFLQLFTNHPHELLNSRACQSVHAKLGAMSAHESLPISCSSSFECRKNRLEKWKDSLFFRSMTLSRMTDKANGGQSEPEGHGRFTLFQPYDSCLFGDLVRVGGDDTDSDGMRY